MVVEGFRAVNINTEKLKLRKVFRKPLKLILIGFQVLIAHWLSNQHQNENPFKSARDETHTMHAIPMIPNEEHDYGSRNFNQRDSNSINPVNWSLPVVLPVRFSAFWLWIFRDREDQHHEQQVKCGVGFGLVSIYPLGVVKQVVKNQRRLHR